MATSQSHNSSQHEPSAQYAPDSEDCSQQSQSKASNKAKRLKLSGSNHVKASKEVTNSTKNKSPWTKQDEIVILEGLLNYSTTDTTHAELYDLLKGSIQGQVTKSQLASKIKTLRRKYKENKDKGIKFGKEEELTKPHEYKVFNLSEKLWGAPNKEKFDNGKPSNGRLYSKHNFSGLDTYIFSNGVDLHLITNQQMTSLQEKWNEVKAAEINVDRKQAKLVGEIFETALRACESSSN